MAGKAARTISRWIAEQPRVTGMVRRRLLAEDAAAGEEGPHDRPKSGRTVGNASSSARHRGLTFRASALDGCCIQLMGYSEQ